MSTTPDPLVPTVNNYNIKTAIIIDTETNISDPSIGCISGYMCYVTGLDNLSTTTIVTSGTTIVGTNFNADFSSGTFDPWFNADFTTWYDLINTPYGTTAHFNAVDYTSITDSFDGSGYNSWWNTDYTTSHTLQQYPPGSGNYVAVRGSNGNSWLLPSGSTICGDFDLKAQVVFGENNSDNVSVHLQLFNDTRTTEVCDLQWYNGISWWWDGGGASAASSYSQYGNVWLRLVRESGVITPYYDNGSGWTSLPNPLSYSGCVTIREDGANRHGIGEFILVADSGLPVITSSATNMRQITPSGVHVSGNFIIESEILISGTINHIWPSIGVLTTGADTGLSGQYWEANDYDDLYEVAELHIAGWGFWPAYPVVNLESYQSNICSSSVVNSGTFDRVSLKLERYDGRISGYYKEGSGVWNVLPSGISYSGDVILEINGANWAYFTYFNASGQYGLPNDVIGSTETISYSGAIAGPNDDQLLTDTWYKGFIVDNSLSSPSRNIDISKVGDYGNLSNFNFSLRNDEKIWNTLDTSGISLVNKRVKVYSVFDEVFYQIWEGVVSDTSRDETSFEVSCEDSSANIHKMLPKEVSNDVVKPVVLGSVQYIEATRVSNSEAITLNVIEGKDIKTAYVNSVADSKKPSTNYLYGTLDIYNSWNITLLTFGVAFNVNDLAGKYIKLSHFQTSESDFEDRQTIDDYLIPIISNYATGYNQTTLTVKSFPVVNPPFYPALFPVDTNKGGALFYTYQVSVTPSSTVKRTAMMVEIIDLANTYVCSQSGVVLDASSIYQYDKDTGTYVKSTLTGTSNLDGTITIDCPVSSEGEQAFSYYHPVDLNIKCLDVQGAFTPLDTFVNRSFTGTYNTNTKAITASFTKNIYTPSGNISAFVKFVDDDYVHNIRAYANVSGDLTISGTNAAFSGYATNPLEFIMVGNSSGIYPIAGTFSTGNVNVGDFTTYLTDKDKDGPSTDVYYNASGDLSLAVYQSGIVYNAYIELTDPILSGNSMYIMPDIESTIRVSAPILYDIACEIKWIPLDMYGMEMEFDSDTYDDEATEGHYTLYINTPVGTLATQTFGFNGLPMNYYTNSPTLSGFAMVPVLDNWYEQIGSHNTLGAGWGFEKFKIPDYIRTLYKNREVKYLKVVFRVAPAISIGSAYPITEYWSYRVDYHLNEIGCVTKNVIDLNEKLYLANTDTSNITTDTVYGSFKYILESNDGIPSSNINYNNLETFRGSGTGWTTGRIFTEQNNSKEYLRELCRQSYVALYPDRKGNRCFNVWLQDTDSGIYDNTNIIRDSIDDIKLTPIRDVFNNFLFDYNYDYAAGKYTKKLVVTKTDESSFPASYDDWSSYVQGISSYATAKSIWDFAHSGYILSGSTNTPDSSFSALSYFVDMSSDVNSPVLMLTDMVGWTARQHYRTKIAVPLTVENINYLELTKPVYISNNVLTNGVSYKGYITNIAYNLASYQIELELIVDKEGSFEYQEFVDPSIIIDAEESRSTYDIYDSELSRTETIESEIDRSGIEELRS